MYWTPLYWLIVWIIASTDPDLAPPKISIPPLRTNPYSTFPTTTPKTRPPVYPPYRPTTLPPTFYPAPSFNVDYRMSNPVNDYNDPTVDTAYRSNRPPVPYSDMGSQAQDPALYYPRIPSVFRTDNPMASYYTQYPTRRIKATTWRPFIKVGPNSDFDSSGSEDEPNYGRPVNYPAATEGSTLPILLDELNTESPVQTEPETVVPFYNPNVPYPYPPEISIQITKQNSREDLGRTYNPFALTTLPTTTSPPTTTTTISTFKVPQPFAVAGINNQYDMKVIEEAKKQLNEFYTPAVRSRKRPLTSSWGGLDELGGSASQADGRRMPDVVPYPQPRNPLNDDFYADGSSKQEKRSDEDCPENPRVPRKL